MGKNPTFYFQKLFLFYFIQAFSMVVILNQEGKKS